MPSRNDLRSGTRSAVGDYSAAPASQQALWLHEQSRMGAGTWNRAIGLALPATVEGSRVQSAICELARRHEALAQEYSVVDGVLRRRERKLFETEASVEQAEQAGSDPLAVLEREAQRPVDLFGWPPFRVVTAVLADGRSLLVVVFPQCLIDAQSLSAVGEDLAAMCGTPAGGLPPAKALVQSGEFGRQPEHVANPEAAASAYWRSQGPRIEEAGELSLPAATGGERDRRAVSMALPEAVAAGVRSLAADENASSFEVLLTALMALMRRYVPPASEGVPVAVSVDNRAWGNADLVGMFANDLPLHVSIGASVDCRTMLRALKAEMTALSEVGQVPLGEALKGIDRGPVAEGMTPPVAATYLRAPCLGTVPGELRPGGSRCWLLPDVGRWPLSVSFLEEERQLRSLWQFDPSFVHPDVLAGLVEQFGALLADAVSDPDAALDRVPIVGDRERAKLLHEYNATEAAYPHDRTIPELFEERVVRHPDAVALAAHGRQITYDELNRRANQIARRLERLGVRRDSLVALSVPRSVELVVALLGILKAGGAYLPLDPDYPPERLRFMLEDSGAVAILAREPVPRALQASALPLVSIDGDGSDLAGEGADERPPVARATSLAYVMYTSGSTGIPKGVEVTHRNVIRLVSCPNYVNLGTGQRSLLLAPISFDASTFEVWGALLTGGVLGIAPPGPLSPREIAGLVGDLRIDTLWLTTALFNAVVDAAAEGLAGVQQLLTGGEAMSPRHARKVIDELPETRLVNCYGPTESTTFATWHSVEPASLERSSVPLGYPIQNTEVHVLDQHLEPVPVGAPGELYVGGDGLARGYRNRPDLTAERFIPNPLETKSERLYRTGDLGRRLPGGEIEFLGRLDHQVKIRGFRIELGEVEAVLGEHPDVREVAAVAAESQAGKRIVAYVVLHEGRSAGAAALRRWVGLRLPDYMVPSGIVRLDFLPLTPSGKLDRAALPPPEEGLGGRETHVEPSNSTERRLAALWREHLGTSRVGLFDNFFELGGDSLLAAGIVERIRSDFKISLPTGVIWERPTLAQLAAAVAEEPRETAQPIGRAERRPIL